MEVRDFILKIVQIKDEVPKHIKKLSKGNIFLCTHLVTTKVHTTGPLMHRYCLWLTFWRSDLLKGIVYSCAEVHKQGPQHSHEDLLLWACCFSRHFLPHMFKPMIYPEKLPSSSILNTFFTAFQQWEKTCACGIKNTCPSLFHHSPPKNICAHRNTPLGTAVIHYVVGLWTTANWSIFLICACIHNVRGKKKVSSKVNR